MPQWQKTALVAVVVAIFAAIVVGAIYVNTLEPNVVIARNLTDSARQEIETELNRLGVHDYTVTDDNSIAVPADRADWVRIELSNLGLLNNLTDADEILLNSSLGESSSDQEARRLVATRTSIENQIVRSYTSVERASAQITFPETQSIFSNQNSRGAAATITIQMRTNQSLTNSQIQGIQSMVSAAIEGLDPSDVTIVDTQLGIISGNDGMMTATEGTSRHRQEIEIQDQIAETLQANIERTLSGMFTSDQFRVNMNVAVDFDEVQRQTTTFGQEGVLRSEQRETETSVASGSTEGAAGVESNADVPNYDATDGDGGTFSQEIEGIIRNYEIDETVEQVIERPELRRTNVVVWIDENALNTTGVNMSEFGNAIALAAGLETDEDEGAFANGEVSIMPIRFLADDIVEEEEPETASQGGMPIFLIAAVALVFPIVGVILFFVMKKRKKKYKMEDNVVEEMFNENDPFEQLAASEEPEQALVEKHSPLETNEPLQNRGKGDVGEMLKEAVKGDKEKASAVIKKWISEG